jgi:oligo-1,6-glucosidase
MTNVKFASIEQYRDIETLNIYREFVERNPDDREEVMRYIYAKGRDNARTPMQWDDTLNAGFTSGTPWLQVNPNYKEINVTESLSDPNSILNYYKKLIKIRRKYPVIVYGNYVPLLKEHDQIFCYLRHLDSQTLLVILNFSESSTEAEMPLEVLAVGSRRILSNYQDVQNESIHQTMKLAPYEADAYLLNQMD